MWVQHARCVVQLIAPFPWVHVPDCVIWPGPPASLYRDFVAQKYGQVGKPSASPASAIAVELGTLRLVMDHYVTKGRIPFRCVGGWLDVEFLVSPEAPPLVRITHGLTSEPRETIVLPHDEAIKFGTMLANGDQAGAVETATQRVCVGRTEWGMSVCARSLITDTVDFGASLSMRDARLLGMYLLTETRRL